VPFDPPVAILKNDTYRKYYTKGDKKYSEHFSPGVLLVFCFIVGYNVMKWDRVGQF
jgi:hypothetical protein